MVDKNVVRFDISVRDAVAVQVNESPHDLWKELLDTVFW